MLPDFCLDGHECVVEGRCDGAAACRRMAEGPPLPAFGAHWPRNIGELSVEQVVGAMDRAVNSGHHTYEDCGCQVHAVLETIGDLFLNPGAPETEAGGKGEPEPIQ